jgi:hypothetical protein
MAVRKYGPCRPLPRASAGTFANVAKDIGLTHDLERAVRRIVVERISVSRTCAEFDLSEEKIREALVLVAQRLRAIK